MATIQIAIWRDQKQEIEADIYGLFAVHLSGRRPEPGSTTWYTITHVRTGLAVCSVYGKKKAQTLATDLNTLLSDGDFSDPDLQDAYYNAFTEGAKALIERYGAYR